MENPKTLDEAIDILKKWRTNQTNQPLRPVDIDTRGIRNMWNLWHGSDLAQWFYAHQIYHADDMSGIIVHVYECEINGSPIDLDQQIKIYHDYWRKTYGPDHLSIMRGQVSKHISKMREDKIDKII